MKKTIIVIVISLMSVMHVVAQDNIPKTDVQALRTANDLSSGNFKDVLNSFFQLAINDLTGQQKEFSFSSNLFAIRLHSNRDLNIDRNFVKKFTTFSRNTNFNWNLKLDSNYRFNGFTFGWKYALINRRDYAISKEFIPLIMDTLARFFALHDSMNNIIVTMAEDSETLLIKYNAEVNRFFTDTTFKFGNFSNELQQKFKPLLISIRGNQSESLFDLSKAASMRNITMKKYNQVKNSFQNKLLWTVDAQLSSYSDQFLFSNIDLNTEAVKGVSDPNSFFQLEFDIKGSWKFYDDSTRVGKDLQRSNLSIEGPFNLVFKNTQNNKSLAELKLNVSFAYVTSGLYEGEKQNSFTLDGTLRFRVMDDLWIPISIKYDPSNGNLFGFLNVKLNFDGLGKSKG